MPQSLNYTANKILTLARERHIRGCLVLSGNEAWCKQRALEIVALVNAPAVCWVGESAPNSPTIRAIPSHATQQLLGSDTDCLVIDARSGLSPDMLGMTAGTLRGGALLLLLTPPHDQWASFDDPDYQRYQALRPSSYAMSGYFLQRAIALLEQVEAEITNDNAWLSVVAQSDSADKPTAKHSDALVKVEQRDSSEHFIPSNEQQSVIQAIQTLSQQPNGSVLLNADRGRGKSVALGLAVKALLAQNSQRILIVAPLRAQVNNLFLAIGECAQSTRVQFIAVDQLIMDAAAQKGMGDKCLCDLLIVDEAAAIPLPMLYQLVDVAPRSVFSSTTHGYEGSGRGFTLRFNDYLLARKQSLQALTLSEPIRWASGDPLEAFFNQLLILNTDNRIDSRIDDQSASDVSVDNAPTMAIRKVSSDELLVNEVLLRAVFGLLVDAHYQTRPSDLRQLLDVPYLHLWIAEQADNGQVIAVLLAYEEGGFADGHDELLQQIVSGKRRPQGNLLSQSLASQSADTQWCRVKSLRVTRIAVAESYRLQGIASNLLNSLESFAVTEGCDYWGSSFGFDSALLAFWQSHNALPVHLGLHRDKASGLRNLMVVKPLTEALAASSHALHQQLLIDLPFWHAQFLADIPSDTLMLLSNGETSSMLESINIDYDLMRIKRFIAGELTYDKVYPSLYRRLMSPKSVFSLAGAVASTAAEESVRCPITEASLRLAPNWAALAEEFQLKGRRDVIASIKTELIQLTID